VKTAWSFLGCVDAAPACEHVVENQGPRFKMPLTPAQKEEYLFLKRQVDYYQDLRFSRDAPADIASKLYRAREELRAFVEEQRRNGVQI
jgi:hypothetical protein